MPVSREALTTQVISVPRASTVSSTRPSSTGSPVSSSRPWIGATRRDFAVGA